VLGKPWVGLNFFAAGLDAKLAFENDRPARILLRKSVERRSRCVAAQQGAGCLAAAEPLSLVAYGFEGGSLLSSYAIACDPPSRGGRLTSLASFRKF
jgi:hypothetical protein